MFLSGILFSAFTVFAAIIPVNTDFTQDAVQYLQNLVLTNSGWTQTGVFLKGSWTSTFYNNLSISGTTTIQDNLTVNWNTLFVDSASNRVGIWKDNPIRTLDVDWTSILRWNTNINWNLSISNNWNVGNNKIEAETSFAVWGITDNGWEPMDNHNRISWKIKNSMILWEWNEIMGDRIYNSIAVWSWNIVYSENENTAVFWNWIIWQTWTKNSLIIGQYNRPTIKTLFQIWNGYDDAHRQNIMTVLSSSKIWILNDDPQTALDVWGALRIGYESWCNSSKKWTIVFSGDNHFYWCNWTMWLHLD